MKLNVTFETGHPAHLDGLDGAVAVVHQDVRPLTGVAVRADWRLNGFLSRLSIGERFRGERGEWLLVHTQGRLPYTHLFLVGMGPSEDQDTAGCRRALAGIAGKVALAGVHAFAIDLTEVVGTVLAPEEAMVVFLEALSRSYPEDDEADPPYQPAIDARQRNETRVAAFRARRQGLIEARQQWEAEHATQPAAERPVAGEVPDEPAPEPPAPPPPDPASLGEPDLEPEPERTVRVVLLGDPGTTAAMRTKLRALGRGESSPLDVEWSR